VYALIAVGVNAEGYREILGIDVTTAEDGAGWLTFLRSLTARGLSGANWSPVMLTPGCWPPWVRTLLHWVYDQPDAQSVAAQYDQIIDALADKLPKVAEHLENTRPDLLGSPPSPNESGDRSGPTTPERLTAHETSVECLRGHLRRRVPEANPPNGNAAYTGNLTTRYAGWLTTDLDARCHVDQGSETRVHRGLTGCLLASEGVDEAVSSEHMRALLGIALSTMSIICLVAAGIIAMRKNRSENLFGALGLVLGPLGVLAAVLVSPGVPKGMQAVSCPRCNAKQNIPAGPTTFECCQCKHVVLDEGDT
jgi:hypothetical protein